MPHVIVKLWPGRTEDQKARLAERIVRDLVEVAGSSESSISVAIEEVKPEDWTASVYRPDIQGGRGTLYKKPGYEPAD